MTKAQKDKYWITVSNFAVLATYLIIYGAVRMAFLPVLFIVTSIGFT